MTFAIDLSTGRDWRPDGSSQIVPTTVRSETEPAPTVAFGHAAAAQEWVTEMPATTVMGDPRLGNPGHRDRAGGEPQFQPGVVRVTLEEAAILQSFPPYNVDLRCLDPAISAWPWQGKRTAKFLQIGNAIPPVMARAILAEVTSACNE